MIFTKMKILAAFLITANADVLKLAMRTAESTNSGRGGHSPKLVVKTCDGFVKFSDQTFAYQGSNGFKSWTVPNFNTVSDVIEFQASTTNAWLVDYMEMQLCDDSGINCRDQPVYEDYSGVKSAGNAFWIDGVCARPNNFASDGCHDTYQCNCYQKKFYVNQVGNHWVMDDNRSICQINDELKNCSVPETFEELGTILKARIDVITIADVPLEKRTKAATLLSKIVEKANSQVRRKCVHPTPEELPASISGADCAFDLFLTDDFCNKFNEFLDWFYSGCSRSNKNRLKSRLNNRCNRVRSFTQR